MSLLDNSVPLAVPATLNAVQNLSSFPPLSVLTLLQTIVTEGYPKSHTLKNNETYDYLVVGAGSAGAALATRLSENPDWTVLNIEAGDYPTAASEEPSTFIVVPHTRIDWDYKPKLPEGFGLSLENQEIFMTRGRAIGGSSDMNYMVVMYGAESDYAEWGHVAPGWDWDGVKPYILKLQNWNDPKCFERPENAQRHSKNGPVLISRATTSNPVFAAIEEKILKCFTEVDVKTLLENNGPDYFGASVPHATLGNGKRSSTAEAYLKLVRDRKNFVLATNSLVTKIILDGNVAIGVEVENSKGELLNVYAKKEVIVSAGTINSPQLLMLSGIGPKKELDKFNIPVVSDLPVGQNMSDHAMIPLFLKGKPLDAVAQDLVTPAQIGYFPVPFVVGNFNAFAPNKGAPPQSQPEHQFQAGQFPALSSPIAYYLCRNTLNIKKSACLELAQTASFSDILYLAVFLNNPDSRGSVTLQSTNPKKYPLIQMGYFTKGEDFNRMLKALELMGGLVNTSCYDGFVDMKTGCLKGNKEMDYGCYIHNIAHTVWHPTGTNIMGPGGVVDERLRVYGVKRLRVADASVMPKITCGNTNIPSIMIGEKGADLIKEDISALPKQSETKEMKAPDGLLSTGGLLSILTALLNLFN